MDITSRTAEAAKAFLTSAGIATVTNFYAELEAADDPDTGEAIVREVPCVTCYGSDARETPMRSGNYRLNLHVLVETSFDDTTPTQFDAICNDVFWKMHTSTIHSDLSLARENFTCIALAGPVAQIPGYDSERRRRRQELVIPLYCCPSDLPA